LESLEFAKLIADVIFTKKGYDIKLLNLSKLSSIADYFLICTADSEIQVKAIADEVYKKLSKQGIKCYHKEGYEALNWVLLDYFDVVVHIFKSESRSYYNLEKLWGDAPVTELKDKAEEVN
jgi:ribosome-associated protein